MTMLLRDEDRGHVIISEAALHLALAEKEININSLLNELRLMAAENCQDDRLTKICAARAWLREFFIPEFAKQRALYLQFLTGLNE